MEGDGRGEQASSQGGGLRVWLGWAGKQAHTRPVVAPSLPLPPLYHWWQPSPPPPPFSSPDAKVWASAATPRSAVAMEAWPVNTCVGCAPSKLDAAAGKQGAGRQGGGQARSLFWGCVQLSRSVCGTCDPAQQIPPASAPAQLSRDRRAASRHLHSLHSLQPASSIQ